MNVAVAGGHGQIALKLLRRLVERGDGACGLVRNPYHADELESVGASPVVCDLEAQDNLAACLAGVDAVVFAAGAGAGSGPERKRTVDFGGAVKLIDAARVTGVKRYVMVSAIGASDPSAGPEKMRPYLEAKSEADDVLARSGLDFTIVRPGVLTDGAGTGRVSAGPAVERGEVTREDVATTLVAVLHADNTIGRTFNLIAGETPIEEALRAL